MQAEERASPFRKAAIPRDPTSMPYVLVAPGGRYFMTEDGEPFLVVGHNEALPWPRMYHMQDERDIATVEAYIKMMAEHGVTVVRIMLEYCEDENWFFEDAEGRPVPSTVQYWDNLVGLCERYKIRLLVQFWDTFFMSRRWEHHPYSAPGSGLDGPGSFCTSPTALEAQKRRIRFFIDRWGDSPAILAYDLLNEIHPYWGGTPDDQHRWLTEIARFTRNCEIERWGKRHLLTVSIFGAKPEEGYGDLVFRHAELDFASTHVYELGLVDNPENTIDCAVVMREAVKYAFSQMPDTRPYTDSESGPIHLFMDLKLFLEEPFESEYYHNMSWAHLATGGAGSGMRWPFRDPHTLSPGMHDVMLGMSRFIKAGPIRWLDFSPQPLDDALQVVPRDAAGASADPHVLPFGCSDGRQALVWLLRDTRVADGAVASMPLDLLLPGMAPGDYVVEFWETYDGNRVGETRVVARDGTIRLPLLDFGRDLAVAVRAHG
jgi:mannan endo-1,4-beta-mannosidase